MLEGAVGLIVSSAHAPSLFTLLKKYNIYILPCGRKRGHELAQEGKEKICLELLKRPLQAVRWWLKPAKWHSLQMDQPWFAYGDTVVLATATASAKPREGVISSH